MFVKPFISNAILRVSSFALHLDQVHSLERGGNSRFGSLSISGKHACYRPPGLHQIPWCVWLTLCSQKGLLKTWSRALLNVAWLIDLLGSSGSSKASTNSSWVRPIAMIWTKSIVSKGQFSAWQCLSSWAFVEWSVWVSGVITLTISNGIAFFNATVDNAKEKLLWLHHISPLLKIKVHFHRTWNLNSTLLRKAWFVKQTGWLCRKSVEDCHKYVPPARQAWEGALLPISTWLQANSSRLISI